MAGVRVSVRVAEVEWASRESESSCVAEVLECVFQSAWQKFSGCGNCCTRGRRAIVVSRVNVVVGSVLAWWKFWSGCFSLQSPYCCIAEVDFNCHVVVL